MRDAGVTVGPPPDLLTSEGGIHINDDSVLPSFDVMIQKNHHFGMEDGDIDDENNEGDETKEGRLLNAFSRYV